MSRLPGLGGLRAAAALVVVAFHAFIVFRTVTGDASGVLGWFFYRYGWTGVDLFFVLSAFLLALPFVGPDPRRTTWHVYAAKRLMRIAPPYYATMALTALVLGTHPWFHTSALEVLRHGLYLHNMYPESVLALNAVFWTLAIEMQFYLVVPFVAPLFRGRRWPIALALAVLVTVAWRAVTFQPGDPAMNFWRTAHVPAFALHFALGMVAARLYTAGVRLPRPTLSGVAGLGAFVGLPLVLFGNQTEWFGANAFWSHVLLRPTLAVGFALLVLAVVDARSALSSALEGRAMRAIGASSYSLYLIHYPVMTAMVLAAPGIVALGSAGFIVLTTTGAVLVGAALYLVVERPSLRWRETVVARLAGHRTTTRTGGAARGVATTMPGLAAVPLPSEHDAG